MNRREIVIGGGLVAMAGSGAVATSFLSMGSLRDYSEAVAQTRVALAENPELKDYIRLARLEANSHNTQAWTFHIEADRVQIQTDYS